MCMFSSPTLAAPVLPPEYAAQQMPDGGAIRDTATRRTANRFGLLPGGGFGSGGGLKTILTSGTGVTTAAPTEKKTLLGQ